MVNLNRIYTRSGDQGQTGLGDGSRVAKYCPRIAAIGTIDEANAVIGVARLSADASSDQMLALIQNDLFDLGADLATPGPDAPDKVRLRIVPAQINRLEAEIDQMNATLAPLRSFVLPGGTPFAAQLHVARTVVRRAERHMTEIAVDTPIGAPALMYVNRLSDHLFVLARFVNAQGTGDVLWVPGANR